MGTAQLNAITIVFDAEISQVEVPFFRSAVSSSIESGNYLFHNHLGGGYLRYSYPLIQYKRIGGRAAIFAIGAATDAIWEFFQGTDYNIRLGKRKLRLCIDKIIRSEVELTDNGIAAYCLDSWLALNEENYKKFQSLESLSERIAMLESVLTGNILSMYKGCGVFIERPLHVKLLDLSPPKTVRYKSIPLVAFDVEFNSNVSVPLYAGLGKHVSVGFGTCYPITK